MSTIRLTLPENLPAPVAFTLFELLRDLTDAVWQHYEPELTEFAMQEYNYSHRTPQHEFDFGNDDLPF